MKSPNKNIWCLILEQFLRNLHSNFCCLLLYRIIAIPAILNTLQFVNLNGIIVEINTIKAMIPTITTTAIIAMALSFGGKSIIFGTKKIIAPINIERFSNRRYKIFELKIKNSARIKQTQRIFDIL